jgi:type I restriction enzyme, R subunit
MSFGEYTEDTLVEQEAIKHMLEDLKYDEHLNCFDEKFPETLGRETTSEVVLKGRLIKAIKKLNSNLPDEAIKKAVDELTKERNQLSLVKANEEVYKLIKDGVKVRIKNNRGSYDVKTVKIIDFEEPSKNEFFLASQFWITGEIYKRRPDLIIFINGLPLVLIELKAPGVKVKRAYDENITDYKETIPQLFWYNAFIIISNGKESKVGSITSGYEHFSEWKKISEEKEAGIISLDTILTGMCDKARCMDLIENFTFFFTLEGTIIKIVAKNHQFLGVNNAIESFIIRKENKGRLGVFWHTQGSGKSYSMIFFAQKVLRKFEGNYTFLVITDRQELDNQIYQNFQNAGVVTEEEVQAESGEHLKKLLTEDHRMVFTLIHKFRTEKGGTYPKLSDRDDIIVMTDEAHRTQYDTLALNMRNAVPNACFIGFTGTPLMLKGEEKTKDTFGKYVSIYNFRASIADKATVPLYYENRVPEMQIINPTLNEDIYDAIEEASLDEAQEDKLSKRLGGDYDVLTRDDRLNAISKDIVDHYTSRGYDGKAMIVTIDKFTTVRMYDKVQYFWKLKLKQLQDNLKKAKYGEADLIKQKIAEMKNTDMAVVISQEQNEVKKFKDKGLDITKHRKRIVTEDLASKFKDPTDSFKIAFICNMWMTGFDAPSVSTIYLDKPMKNHTLMQAIARANRVFKEKPAGFIVDYINVFRNLKKALAIYAAPIGGDRIDLPIQSKDALVKALDEYIKKLNKFLGKQSIDYETIIKTKGLKKIALLDAAVSQLVINDKVKKDFLVQGGNSIKVYKAILPHKDATKFSSYVALYQELVKEIRSLDPDVDISSVMGDIQSVLDKSISSKGYIIRESTKKQTIDLSKIDFDALSKQFEKKKNNADMERLKNILSFKLKEMVQLNNMRIDFQERFQALIDDYNSGSMNQENFFKELVKFSKALGDEDRRKIVEKLTEEELSLFDKLKKPKLTDKEKSQVKNCAKELLHKLKNDGLTAVDWRKKQRIRAQVRKEIEVELDRGLPKTYTQEDYDLKCNVAFQHVFDNYLGEGRSIFQGVASYGL